MGGLCASHFAELVTAAVEQANEDEKRANLVAVDTTLSAAKGPFTRWVNDVVTSVPAAVHARSWKHLMAANQKEWSDVVAAASEDFANGCLFKVPETGKGKAEADAFIEELADAAQTFEWSVQKTAHPQCSAASIVSTHTHSSSSSRSSNSSNETLPFFSRQEFIKCPSKIMSGFS